LFEVNFSVPVSSMPNPPPEDNDRSSSVDWLMSTQVADLHDPPEPAPFAQPIRPRRRSIRPLYGAGLAVLALVVLGEAVLWARPGLRAELFGSTSKTDAQSPAREAETAIAKPPPVALIPAAPPPKIVIAAPPKIVPAPEPAPPPVVTAPPPIAAFPAAPKPEAAPDAAAKPAPLPPLPIAAPPPAQIAASDAPAATAPPAVKPVPPAPEADAKAIPAVVAAAPPSTPPSSASTPLAQQTAPAATAPDQHFTVMLSYPAALTQKGAAFGQQLRDEGFTVITKIIAADPNRWPGVAFFYDSDVDKAARITRQLSAVTGRQEHARLSNRRPYPHAGVVEVSLLDHGQPKPAKSAKPHHKHHSS
jgi:hypothetical protein